MTLCTLLSFVQAPVELSVTNTLRDDKFLASLRLRSKLIHKIPVAFTGTFLLEKNKSVLVIVTLVAVILLSQIG
jgi:hypothetical protein